MEEWECYVLTWISGGAASGGKVYLERARTFDEKEVIMVIWLAEIG